MNNLTYSCRIHVRASRFQARITICFDVATTKSIEKPTAKNREIKYWVKVVITAFMFRQKLDRFWWPLSAIWFSTNMQPYDLSRVVYLDMFDWLVTLPQFTAHQDFGKFSNEQDLPLPTLLHLSGHLTLLFIFTLKWKDPMVKTRNYSKKITLNLNQFLV